MANDEEELTKVRVDLPNHWATGGESVWARPLGNDLYELRNVPFHAYGLNFFDVVFATADAPDLKPQVRSVVRSSGHRTLRFMFKEGYTRDRQQPRLDALVALHTTYERADEKYIAVDVAPPADYAKVCDLLAEWEETGVAVYETCEQRVPGSFDDMPDEEASN